MIVEAKLLNKILQNEFSTIKKKKNHNTYIVSYLGFPWECTLDISFQKTTDDSSYQQTKKKHV